MSYEVKKQQGGESTSLATRTAGIVLGYLIKNRDVIIGTLPEGFNYDRMCRSVVNAISTTPALARCTVASLFLSTVRAFSIGLEPNGALQEGYLVPYGGEAQFLPSYRGLIQLARRSGEISDVYAKAVYSNDTFEVEEGTERKIVHKPDYSKDRGDAVCYYAMFRTTAGTVDFEVMSKKEIDKIRALSKAANSPAWKEHYEEMAKKSVLKRLLKRAPMSIDKAKNFSAAIELENKAAMGETQSDAVLDIEGLDMPDESATPAEVQREINADRAEELKAKLAEKKGAAAAATATETSDSLM